MMKKMLPLLLACAAFTGCSTTLTNLTPTQQVRNPSGSYPFEVLWDSTQYNIKQNTIKAFVVINLDAYPMHRTAMLTNRWEALVPVPKDASSVHYRYKFDYEYRSLPEAKPGSKMSDPYKLEIIER